MQSTTGTGNHTDTTGNTNAAAHGAATTIMHAGDATGVGAARQRHGKRGSHHDHTATVTAEEAKAAHEADCATRCVKLITQGLVSKGRRALHASPMAPENNATLAVLRALHPPQLQPLGSGALRLSPPVTAPLITEEAVLNTITAKARNGSAGPSGWSYALLAQALKRGPRTVLALVTGFANAIAAGLITKESATSLWHKLTAGRLVALEKATGGTRPICVSEVVLRLSLSIAIAACHDDVEKGVGEGQLGVRRNGTEVAALAAHMRLRSDTDTVAIMVDAQAAFQNLSRTAVLAAVKANVPRLHDAVLALYANTTKLTYGDGGTVIESRTGVRQGDPLSSAVFALGVEATLRRVRAAHTTTTVLSFLDDNILISSSPAAAWAAVDALADGLAEIGITLNHNKTILTSLSTNPEYVATIHAINAQRASRGLPPPRCSIGAEAGMVYVGLPIGSDGFQRAHVAKAFDDAVEEAHRLVRLPSKINNNKEMPPSNSTQAIFQSLRLCIQPAVVHLLRFVHPSVTAEAAKKLDDDTLAVVLPFLDLSPDSSANAALREDIVRTRAFLPAALSGLGLQSAVATADGAYIGMLAACLAQAGRAAGVTTAMALPEVDKMEEVLGRQERVLAAASAPRTIPELFAGPTPRIQRVVTAGVRAKSLADLMRRIPDNSYDQLLLLSCSGQFSPTFLTALPTESMKQLADERDKLLEVSASKR